MNQKEIAEIRRRFQPDKNAIANLRGCYVNEKREIVSAFDRPLMSLPQEEAEKYLAFFRRALTGLPGKNLLTLTFRPDQVMDGEEHALLTALRNTELKVDEGVERLYRRIIDSLNMDSNYLILLAHDAYDIPYRGRDGLKVDDASEEVFHYFVCCICPVKLTKPALSYDASDNEFHDRELDWVVTAPQLGFMFPTFDDRAANIYDVLWFSRDTEDVHGELIDALFNLDSPMPAQVQKETFQQIIEDAVGEDLSFDVAESVHEGMCELIEAQKQDKELPAPVVTKADVKRVLQEAGVPQERVDAFDEQFDQEFGVNTDLGAQNIVEPKKFEVRTPDVVITVNPERSDLVTTRVIDGMKYILIEANDAVQVNGIGVHIS